MSLMFDGGIISSTTFILSGFASIPQLLTIKPKNFPTETPKAHLAGFNFILYLFRTWNALDKWVMWSLSFIDFTSMSSIYTSINVPICFWNILFTSLWYVAHEFFSPKVITR